MSEKPMYPRGFTLVELLVVIGIIALLISILLPSLNRARHSAEAITCASNLRQVGTLMAMYTSKWSGWLVPQGQASPEGHLNWNDTLIADTLGDSKGVQLSKYWRTPFVAYANPRAYGFMYCPTMAGRGYVGYNTWYGTYTNYAANWAVMPEPLPRTLLWLPHIKVTAIKATTTTAVAFDSIPLPHLGEAVTNAGAYVRYQVESGEPNSAMGFIHNGTGHLAATKGTSNVLFIDGHVEGIRDPGTGQTPPVAWDPVTGVLWQ